MRVVKRGFSLIEQLVALLIIIVGIISIYIFLSKFTEFTRDRLLATCLVDTAYSSMSLCLKGITPPNNLKCGSYNVEVIANCNIPEDECNDVSVTTRINSFSYTLQGFGCKFNN